MTLQRMPASEKIKLLESQITNLTNRCEKQAQKIKRDEWQIGELNTRCDRAERQARSLTLELQAARRQIAQLQSLTRPEMGAKA